MTDNAGAQAPGQTKRSSWLANLPLQWKFGSLIVILVSLFLLLLGANTLTLYLAGLAQKQADELVSYVEMSNTTARAINQRQAELIQATFTRPEALDTRLQAADLEVARSITNLQNATNNLPALREFVHQAAQINDRWSDTVALSMVTLARKRMQGNIEGEGPALQAFLQNEAGDGGSRAILARLDQMNNAADTILRTSRIKLERAQNIVVWIDAIALLAVLLAGIGALYLTSRLIGRPLRHLADLMERLANHDHTIEVPYTERRDEVGIIGRALAVFRAMAQETYEANWVKTAAASLSSRLQATEDVENFAGNLLDELAPSLNAGVGVFYSFDAQKKELNLTGTYAYKARRHVTTSYRLGEGVVGQCARNRTPILLSPVPDDYITIHSGTGEATPAAVFAIPLVNKGQLLGVMEFAAFEPFSGKRQALVNEVAPMAALSLENLTRAVRTLELLEQTQRQTNELRVAEEELRTQQEELRATNEQLQQQSQKLAASEEELRVQAEELQSSNEVLRHKSEELETQKHKLEDMNQEIEARADDLARANQYKSQFLANMSHELRTPLNSLLILAHDLAENRAGHLDDEEIEAANIIHGSGTNLLRLINDILDLSKVEAGKMDVVREPVSIPAIAARMERNFRHVAQEKGLDFTVSIAPDAPPQIITDDGKLEQITNNLLSNAFKFTTQGSVRVTFARGAADKMLDVEVTDTGIGIPEDKKDFIFQAFEQVDSSTRRQFGGTGLGLAITLRLARLLGGDVTVQSTPGAGSTFRLSVPVGEGASSASTTGQGGASTAPTTQTPALMPPAAPAVQIANPTPVFDVEDDRATLEKGDTIILAVEDDPAFARTLVNLVRRKGYKALAAGDGVSALELARAHKPTGILLDVMLPGMDGWTVISRLKADPATRHIPVHFVSALDEERRGRDLGAVGFLTKPVTAEALNDALALLTHFSPDHLRRVLVVDDDATSRLAVRKLLSGEQVEMVEADSAEKALELIGQGGRESSPLPFDCIVLDLGLPGMSGFDFLEALATDGQQVPVVVYSGRDLTAEESMKLRAFTDSIVVKGALSPERLLDEVSLFLHSVRQEIHAVPMDPDGDLKGRKLLLVDDDMRNIYALAKVLRGKGLEVSLAQDGAKAIAQLDAQPDVEIVLMDIMMPVMDGYEAMTEIRKNPAHAKLPIIALTAKAMKDDREKCLASGASDYLAKPVDVPKLLSMIRAWLPPR
ncbi:response regulator [Xanthobacter sp. TB0139]|uniref:response regulator n=1 Tax=Xanthobacter sp. TB0139 TaxID=3459178 RepID=UPI00403922A5